ncbi:CGNR zinc finger domain-containing protein [Alicyclobacillus fastidiosus]|uniref:CGNR zinc finger domain-containing protein n=1 Tax=Alicyclobacillus fastidiosus TaxID=392011 RepID=A0ABV5AI17_9BACL|nr:CGNR zinc finger domain-containing protein [Alicyclobacillus fastidiosus]WEH10107.1 CGNR zinc finger domain-containing protein [Alicyclobacillus fastidiosus]
MAQSEQFPLISGHLSLDLVNTELVRRGTRHDLLVTVEDLTRWVSEMNQSGSLHPSAIPDVSNSPEVLQNVRKLRQVLRYHFVNITEGVLPSDDFRRHWEGLIANAPFAYRLIGDSLVQVPIGTPSDAVASLVSLDVLRLLATGELLTLRRCANPDCVLLFFDATGKRKWCSMRICGNRAKVARHEHRRKTPTVGNQDMGV